MNYKRHSLLFFSFIFIAHSVRDYLQFEGIDNLYTNFIHVPISKTWELGSMFFFVIFAIILFIFYLKT